MPKSSAKKSQRSPSYSCSFPTTTTNIPPDVKRTHLTLLPNHRKPATAVADPYPSPTVIPKFTKADDKADYESELAVIIGKPCKDVPESEALDYVLGYTASNDVSSRARQFSQSQWGFSKGFDGACPLGPVLVSSSLVPDPSKLHMRGLKNGQVEQDSGIK